MFLITVTADDGSVEPYRLASSYNEAEELIGEYLRIGPDRDWTAPDGFKLWKEIDGKFESHRHYNHLGQLLFDRASLGTSKLWIYEFGRPHAWDYVAECEDPVIVRKILKPEVIWLITESTAEGDLLRYWSQNFDLDKHGLPEGVGRRWICR